MRALRQKDRISGRPDIQTRRLFRRLGRLCGIALSYTDFNQQHTETDPASLIALVNAMEDTALSASSSAQEIESVIGHIRQNRRRTVAPVMIGWGGRLPPVWFWACKKPDRLTLELHGEDGRIRKHIQDTIEIVQRGDAFRIRALWPDSLPYGYHILYIYNNEEVSRSLVISAPERLADRTRDWGVFAPTYALRSDRDQGIGGFKELKEAVRFTGEKGGAFLGTLPLLAAAYEGPGRDESPYTPYSRLFWNEIFLDVPGLEKDVSPIVDYEGVYTRKKQALMQEAQTYFDRFPEGDAAFQAYVTSTPYLLDYAAYRAQSDETLRRFHLYVQYACHQQMLDIRNTPNATALYLDYPVGVHPRGFDRQHFAGQFVDGLNVGAPPDMFGSGQDWGFRPLHPHALAEDEFRYVRATIRHHFRYARMLRIDHIMGLYRLYCIPRGSVAAKGAYIYYPFQALLAILCLEAYIHDGVLIGEDLGVVPARVRDAMETRGIGRMWILPFELKATMEKTFAAITPEMIAALNTHDMFPFAAFLSGADVTRLAELKLIDQKTVAKTLRSRSPHTKAWKKHDNAFIYILDKLAASPARHIIVNLEDLWEETNPQNIPGTTGANWRQRFKFTLEQWPDHKAISRAFDCLNKHRKKP